MLDFDDVCVVLGGAGADFDAAGKVCLNPIPFIHIYPEQQYIMEIFKGHFFFFMTDYVFQFYELLNNRTP